MEYCTHSSSLLQVHLCPQEEGAVEYLTPSIGGLCMHCLKDKDTCFPEGIQIYFLFTIT